MSRYLLSELFLDMHILFLPLKSVHLILFQLILITANSHSNECTYLLTLITRAQNWPTLEQRRRISKAIMLYKILNNLVAIPADKYTTPNNNCTRGHPQRLKTVSCHTNVFLHSFFPSTIVIWNNLPSCVIDSNNTHEFKSSIFNSL